MGSTKKPKKSAKKRAAAAKPAKKRAAAPKKAPKSAPKKAPKKAPKSAPKKAPRAAKPKVAASASAASMLARLQVLCSAHPGLVLEGHERATFTRECPPLASIVTTPKADPELLVYCAWAYRKMGHFREAVAAAERAVAAERSWRTLTAKASVHRAYEQTDMAVSLFEEAAALDPTDTAALMEAGRTLGEAGRFKDAAQRFGRVVERDPERTDAALWGAYSSFCDSKDSSYVKIVRKIAKEDPADELAQRLLGEMS